MKDFLRIPSKFSLPESIRESLRSSPVVVADVGSAMGLDERWAPVTEFLEIFSFEPDARSDGDGKIFQTALGEKSEESRTLHLAKLPAASSFYRHSDEIDRFAVREWLERAGEIKVPVSTLDECLGDSEIDFLKIDAEGADLDILRGGVGILANVLVIQVEVSFAQRHDDAPGFAEIDRFLVDRGFRLHTVETENWLRDNVVFGTNSTPQLIWGDAVYVREGTWKESDLPKWLLLLQAYGFHDYAVDRMPGEWEDAIRRSVRGHGVWFFQIAWRLILASVLLPFFWKRIAPRWRKLVSELSGEVYRMSSRTGPKKGIVPGL